MSASVMFAYVMFHDDGHFIQKSVVVLVCIVVVLVLFVCVSSACSVPPVPLDFSNILLFGWFVRGSGVLFWLFIIMVVRGMRIARISIIVSIFFFCLFIFIRPPYDLEICPTYFKPLSFWGISQLFIFFGILSVHFFGRLSCFGYFVFLWVVLFGIIIAFLTI